MKHIAMKHTVFIILALLLLSVGGCASGSQVDSDRLAALEAEVAALRARVVAQESAFKEELGQIRKNLEGIHELVELDKARSGAEESPRSEAEAKKDALDDDLDIKAKSFVNENLDRLLDITKKLLDKMESEIDEQMKKNETEAPADKGETI